MDAHAHPAASPLCTESALTASLAFLPITLACSYNGYFVDLFVRVSNAVAVRLYYALGYTVYRRVLSYYGGNKHEPPEDALDLRKRLPRDETGSSVIPLAAPVTAEDVLR
jgi:N-terminal acetyltransferase B complex catalytic subunit